MRDEIAGNSVNRVQRFYYVDSKRDGDVGNDGLSRTDYAQVMANRGSNKANYKNWKPVSSADFDQKDSLFCVNGAVSSFAFLM